MDRYQIAVVVGSLRRNSCNRQLANAVIELAPPELSFHDLRIDDLPLYNQDAVFIHVKGRFIEENGNIGNADSREFLQTWMDRYVAWVKQIVQGQTHTDPVKAGQPSETGR